MLLALAIKVAIVGALIYLVIRVFSPDTARRLHRSPLEHLTGPRRVAAPDPVARQPALTGGRRLSGQRAGVPSSSVITAHASIGTMISWWPVIS